MAASRPQGSTGLGNEAYHIQDGTSALQRAPRQGPICREDSPIAIEYAYGVLYVKQAWAQSGRYVPAAIVKHAGADFADLLSGILPAMLMSAGLVVVSTGVGASVGAGIGALAGGVNAVPGAIVGAEMGLSVGVSLL